MTLPSDRSIRIAVLLVAGSVLGALWPLVGWIFAASILLLGLGVLLESRRISRGTIHVQRHIPTQLSLGEPEVIVEEVENRHSFPVEIRIARSASDAVILEPRLSEVLPLAPWGRGRLRFTVTVCRRGESVLGRARVRLGLPGGLALRQVTVAEEGPLRVFPNLRRLQHYEVLRHARALSGFGIHAATYGNLGTEFDHLRLYGRDDDYRRIHWKATARRGFPITQVVRTERGQSVLIAVDVSHWMGLSAGTLSRLDSAVDAALFLAHVAWRAGDRVGLALFAQDVIRFLPPSCRPGQTRRILEALYRAQPHPVHPSYRNLAHYILSQRIRRSLLVVLSEPMDPETAEELRLALACLRPRHLPLCVGLRDPALEEMAALTPSTWPSLCRRLAAREILDEREQHRRTFQKLGLRTLDVLPSELSVSLVNRYLELKYEGAL